MYAVVLWNRAELSSITLEELRASGDAPLCMVAFADQVAQGRGVSWSDNGEVEFTGVAF